MCQDFQQNLHLLQIYHYRCQLCIARIVALNKTTGMVTQGDYPCACSSQAWNVLQPQACHASQTPGCSGKTVEEVWSAIHSNKTSSAYETVTLGNFLQSVGLDLPASVSSDPHLSNLQLPVAPHVKVSILSVATSIQYTNPSNFFVYLPYNSSCP